MSETTPHIGRRVIKAATISFNHAAVISCTVRAIADTGATLSVASPLGIPEQFDLIIESDRKRLPCRVLWRQERQIGVEFRTAK